MSDFAFAPRPLDILSVAVALPNARLSFAQIRESEALVFDGQLAAMSSTFRARVTAELGIEQVAALSETENSRSLVESAALSALEQANVLPSELGLILDYSTIAVDCPEIWSLAHHLQGSLGAGNALALGTRGSGCAGLHLSLLVAQAMMTTHPSLHYVLLAASDRAPSQGRSCLPISIMADAASAMVLARADKKRGTLGRVRSVVGLQYGKFADILRLSDDRARMLLDVERFEKHVLPLHFVMLHRALGRACKLLDLSPTALKSYVYPNTTALDRSSIARGFGVADSDVVGPGPKELGHAFASDLLINAEGLLNEREPRRRGPSAWLAAGSGFTWGAAIVEVGG